MYLLIFRQIALRWDLPDRFMATLAVTFVTICAIVAGGCQQLNESLADSLDMEMPFIATAVGLGTIATTYAVFMLGTAIYVATPKTDGAFFAWIASLGLIVPFYVAVTWSNLPWLWCMCHTI